MKHFIIYLIYFSIPVYAFSQKAIRIDSRDTTVFKINNMHGKDYYHLRNDTILAPGNYEVWERYFKRKNPIMRFQIGNDGQYCGIRLIYDWDGKVEYKQDYGSCNTKGK